MSGPEEHPDVDARAEHLMVDQEDVTVEETEIRPAGTVFVPLSTTPQCRKVWVACVEAAAKERAYIRNCDRHLEIRHLEIAADKEVRLRQLELLQRLFH